MYQHASPDPVYLYLARVYKVVTSWPKAERVKYAREMLKLANKPVPTTFEPFAMVILCTSSAARVDNKHRNRWARALQYADQNNINSKALEEFIVEHGGLAKCGNSLF
jgi:hypothetical protein